MEGTAERKGEFRDRTTEITQSEQQEKQTEKIKNEQSLRELWDHNKRCNICVIGVPGGEKKD